jgi:hypothetical protein
MKDTFISITIGSKAYTIDNTHHNFEAVRNAIRNKEWDSILPLIDIKQVFEKWVAEDLGDDEDVFNIDYQTEVITYMNTPLHNTLTKRIFAMWKEGFDVKPMVMFLRNLMNNPSSIAVRELYDFLETGNMPITEDGHFLAYKKIRSDYRDIHTGKIDNSVGQKPEMPRNMVDDNRNNTCSQGLHFCSQSYLERYGSSSISTRVVILKINPADVVSIPADYNNTKGRCWKYEVYGEVDSVDAHDQTITFETSVYPSKADSKKTPEIFNVDDLQKKLLQVPNTVLVRVFNLLTNSSLVKFRDKITGVTRICNWVKAPNEHADVMSRIKQVNREITFWMAPEDDEYYE